MEDERQDNLLFAEPLSSSVPKAVDPEQTHSGRVVGSKISEKIKAMQCGMSNGVAPDCLDTTTFQLSPASKESIKLNVSVKSLALNLNINPLALKVGARPPKPRHDDDIVSGPNKDNTLSDAVTSTVPQEDNERVDPDNFIEAIKTRAKIQSKRRPPTKRLLKSSSMKQATEEVESEPEQTDINSSKQLKLSLSGAKSDPDRIKNDEKGAIEPIITLEEGHPEELNSDTVIESAPILEQEEVQSLELREEAVQEKTSKSKASSCLFYVMRLIIPRNLGGVVTVAASLLVFLFVSILIQTFITSQQSKR